jgi:pyruvate formate lyase activating enzyme
VAEGLIFDIQHFAVHDGPGIRTLVFLKGCPLSCEWCCNPESQSFQPQLRYIEFKCKKCFKCIDSCHFSSISKADDQLNIDFPKCSLCRDKSCTETCNHGALTITGEKYSVDKLVGIIRKDIDFYKNSGGGVTFSGGEPLSQPKFLVEVLKECKKLNIHTAIETCGFANKQVIKDVIEYTDLFLFDVKIINNVKHFKHTGKPNDIILSNLEFISKSGKKIILRVPLIQGINDDNDNMEGILKLAKKLNINDINIEPYHSLGEDKYSEFGMKPKIKDVKLFDQHEIQNFVDFFNNAGLNCELA